MTQVTVTDYETVEVEKEMYECDHCSARVAEDEMNTVGYATGVPRSTARFSDESVNQKHLCEGCIGLREAHELEVEQQNKLDYCREWWTNTRKLIGWLAFVVPAFVLGMATMLLAGSIHNAVENPVWMMDLFIAFCLSFAFATFGGVMANMIMSVMYEPDHKD